ncbi:hypothetical protein TREMEDRAFT_59155 [Tremella mesenterica DSM 1558]|uniref:uncharacterized protein n=1 Tax=Tremella mesenterica (strain ATCC 24925 / CBS 8224 / DSM 1558 / NBRC 9311 / NRRL Y-6157 / RJB 2259-6 / UBC 559-6) TaxID=578456 RepID=UPI0003F48CD7|nr:uncharacterized protein TREMEDRAFT_59155 [Tremella mesenterica DSM 1558]EIW72995.1 hypothetical protein TREMEDRAFT_59155 [Tremella mesenterica DSM 1558]
MPGYLGELPNMVYDPIRERYFPKSRPPPSLTPYLLQPLLTPPPTYGPSNSTMFMSNAEVSQDMRLPSGSRKSRVAFKVEGHNVESLPTDCTLGNIPSDIQMVAEPVLRRARPTNRFKRHPDNIRRTIEDKHLRSLRFENKENPVICRDETITSLIVGTKSSYVAATDHGRLIVRRPDKTVGRVTVCSDSIFAVHIDIPRMSTFGDIFCSTMYNGLCSIGMILFSPLFGCVLLSCHPFHVFQKGLYWSNRKMPSDVLAVTHETECITYCGTRSGKVFLCDMRIEDNAPKPVLCQTNDLKAVVGLKRLKDETVPWGLVLLIFDTRFAKTPLLQLEGHVNGFLSGLGLTTTPDHRHLLAAGSDRRIRAWSTQTGEQIHPDLSSSHRSPKCHPTDISDIMDLFSDIDDFHTADQHQKSPLEKVFDSRVNTLAFGEDDWALNVVLKGEVQRFEGTMSMKSSYKL